MLATVESPVGVGFSYSDNPDVDYNTDDNKTALDNYHFLVDFFRSFPEYRNNDFYIECVNTSLWMIEMYSDSAYSILF